MSLIKLSSKTLIIYIFLSHCSFDDKTGIWNSNNNISKKENNLFKEFKTLSGNEEYFEKEIAIKKNFIIDLPKKKINENWNDILSISLNNSINNNCTELKAEFT